MLTNSPNILKAILLWSAFQWHKHTYIHMHDYRGCRKSNRLSLLVAKYTVHSVSKLGKILFNLYEEVRIICNLKICGRMLDNLLNENCSFFQEIAFELFLLTTFYFTKFYGRLALLSLCMTMWFKVNYYSIQLLLY